MAGLLKRILGRDRGEALRCSAVVAAAGSSTRMGEDKLTEMISTFEEKAIREDLCIKKALDFAVETAVEV